MEGRDGFSGAPFLHDSNLVLQCDCVQQSVHARTSNVPEGLEELSSTQLFRDFSYCRTEQCGLRVWPLATPTIHCCSTAFHYIVSFYKMMISCLSCSPTTAHGTHDWSKTSLQQIFSVPRDTRWWLEPKNNTTLLNFADCFEVKWRNFSVSLYEPSNPVISLSGCSDTGSLSFSLWLLRFPWW